MCAPSISENTFTSCAAGGSCVGALQSLATATCLRSWLMAEVQWEQNFVACLRGRGFEVEREWDGPRWLYCLYRNGQHHLLTPEEVAYFAGTQWDLILDLDKTYA